MSRNAPYIILLGLRASGKTTCGRLLAKRLGVPFVDLDDVTRSKFGEASVGAIWSKHGEAGWRRAESEAIAEVMQSQGSSHRPAGLVLALGGGTPMVQSAREVLEQARRIGGARIVYLRASASVLQSRLKLENRDRPSLTGEDPADEVSQILALREPTFIRLSDEIICAEGSSPSETVDAILRLLA